MDNRNAAAADCGAYWLIWLLFYFNSPDLHGRSIQCGYFMAASANISFGFSNKPKT